MHRPQRPEVVLEAGDEHCMSEARRASERIEGVAQHRTIDRAVLGLRRLALPRGEEQVGDVEAGQRLLEARRIQDIGGHVLHAGNRLRD